MHSNKVSVIIALVIIVVNTFLLIVYYGKQGEHTFSFIKSLYEEIRVDQSSVDLQAKWGDLLVGEGKWLLTVQSKAIYPPLHPDCCITKKIA